MMAEEIKKELMRMEDEKKAAVLKRFFKTGKGEYGEGDKFLGVMVPKIRELVSKYWKEIGVVEVERLVRDEYHEVRLLGLLLWVKQFEKGDEEERREIFERYVKNTRYVNNWDLVDLTTEKIVGEYLFDKDDGLLDGWVVNESLWKRRMAIMATFAYIKKGEHERTLEIVEKLLDDKEDLIHKATGWMLREVGKRCGEEKEEIFLKKYYRKMPRTMLRYAIERFNENKRRMYLEGRI